MLLGGPSEKFFFPVGSWNERAENKIAVMVVRRRGGTTGICPPVEIGTRKQKFFENVKSAV